MDFSQVVGAYRAIRDARSALSRQFKEQDEKLKADQDKLGAVLLQQLNDSGGQSTRTDQGTYFRVETIKPSVADWRAFYDWIRDNDGFDMLERRVKSTSVKDFMEENQGLLPPGVNVIREYEVRVRSPNE